MTFGERSAVLILGVIADEELSRRSIWVDNAMDIIQESAELELPAAVLCIIRGQVWFPTNSQVQREPRRNTIRVLSISSKYGLSQRIRIGVALGL